MNAKKQPTSLLVGATPLLLATLVAWFPPTLLAQQAPPLGSPAPQQPELFAPGLVSTGLNEAFITISPKGDELFFGNVEPPFAIIVQVRRSASGWLPPRTAPFSGRYDDAAPMFAPDGNRLYFVSKRPITGEGEPSDNNDIWFVERTSEGWSAARNLGPPVNSAEDEGYLSVAASGNLYIMKSEREKFRTTADIYCARFVAGQYQEPVRLGPAINTEHIEADPFVAPDESYLIFASEGRDDSQGWVDLYVSFRQEDGQWAPAVNLGPPVNTTGEEFNPFVSWDGKSLFFNRHVKYGPRHAEEPVSYQARIERHSNPGNGPGDILWVDAQVIETLR